MDVVQNKGDYSVWKKHAYYGLGSVLLQVCLSSKSKPCWNKHHQEIFKIPRHYKFKYFALQKITQNK